MEKIPYWIFKGWDFKVQFSPIKKALKIGLQRNNIRGSDSNGPPVNITNQAEIKIGGWQWVFK